MARKTNKTAHVLNLLSGSSGHKGNTPEEEAAQKENTAESGKISNSEKPSGSEKSSVSVPGIQMDTRGLADPVSDIIHQQLLSAFEQEAAHEEASDTKDPADTESVIAAESTAAAGNTAVTKSTASAENTAVTESTASAESAAVTESTANAESAAVTEHASVATNTAAAQNTASDNHEDLAAKEPEFILLNVMEEIVRHKIIYFMRQFEVCTCDRCVADTVALTLNGLPPKYIVTPPAAASPLVSFYTNKYISDITVEATKACMAIKENPRH